MSEQRKSLLERIKDASQLLQGAAALLVLLTAIAGFVVTTHLLRPGPTTTTTTGTSPTPTTVAQESTVTTAPPSGWEPLGADQVTVSAPSSGDGTATNTGVTIGGANYAGTSETLTEGFYSSFDTGLTGPDNFDVGFVLSKRYSEFRVVFGIPDNAQCCPMPMLTYSIDSEPAAAPVTLQLGQPDSIDVQVTGASRLDVNLVFSGKGTAAFGGAEGMPVSH